MLSSRNKVMLWMVFFGALCLPGATCNVQRPPPAIQASGSSPTGPSAFITPPPASLNVTPASWFTGSNPPNRWSTTMLGYYNNYRSANGLNQLIWHDGLAAVAEVWAKDIVNKYWPLSIVSPQGYDVYQMLVGASPSISFTSAFAIPWNTNGNSSLTVYNALLANPTFKAQLDSPNWTHIGSYRYYNTEILILGENVSP